MPDAKAKPASAPSSSAKAAASADGGRVVDARVGVAGRPVGQDVAELAGVVGGEGGRLVDGGTSFQKGAHLSIASSRDKGRTWSSPVQITRDNEHPADLITLADGDVLLTYGERNPALRCGRDPES